jgi:hypothetical protein
MRRRNDEQIHDDSTIIAATPEATPTSHIGTPTVFGFASIIVGCWICPPYGPGCAYTGAGARLGSPGLYVGANAAGEYCGPRWPGIGRASTTTGGPCG